MPSTLTAPLPRPDPHPTAETSARRAVLTFAELAARLPLLQPPAAYRLSLDSGIGYKNVRRAFEQPMAIRLQTWEKLLRSLNIRLVAAGAGDCAGSGPTAGHGALLPATPGPAGADAGSLRSRRLALGWSRRELARRAGVGVDAIASLESGCGLAGTLSRVCGAMGVQLLLALPPEHVSLEHLWEERAVGCLRSPAQYPPARRRPASANRGTQRRAAAQETLVRAPD